MTGLKIKQLFFFILTTSITISSYSQQIKRSSIGISAGYTESLNYLTGINYNFSFEQQVSEKMIYHFNSYWLSDNNSISDFSNGGPTINLIDYVTPEVGSVVLQDETTLTGIEGGIGYKILEKERLRLFLNIGINYQKLVSNRIETSVIPEQEDMTNFGIYSASYNRNHFGYFASSHLLTRITPKIWVGPEIKWRGYFGINPQPHPVIFNSLNMNSINLNLKLMVDI